MNVKIITAIAGPAALAIGLAACGSSGSAAGNATACREFHSVISNYVAGNTSAKNRAASKLSNDISQIGDSQLSSNVTAFLNDGTIVVEAEVVSDCAHDGY
jgi:hypothetical protein